VASDLMLRRKWTFKAHGKQVVFVKHAKEHSAHVVIKALLWALYLPDYPHLSVEIPVGDRFKPDVVALGTDRQPLFWGEAGKVGIEKFRSLVRRYRHTHFALAKWSMNVGPLIDLVDRAATTHPRSAPFDILRFPADSAERFIDHHGRIRISHTMVEWTRIGPGLTGTASRPEPADRRAAARPVRKMRVPSRSMNPPLPSAR
jgi:hypothetical protein